MKKLKIIPILFATAFLAGCNNINPSSSSISSPSSNSSSATSGTTASSNATSNSTTDSATSTSSSSSPSSISSSSTSSSTPTIEEGVSKYSHFQSISNKSRQAGFLPSLGNPNILVIPVDFQIIHLLKREQRAMKLLAKESKMLILVKEMMMNCTKA